MTNTEPTTPTIQAPSFNARYYLAFDLWYYLKQRKPPELVESTLQQAMELATSVLLRDPESRAWLYANVATQVTRDYMDADAAVAS